MRNHWLKTLIPAVALAALPVIPTTSTAAVAVGVSINIAPPPLPVYVQPAIPAPGYMWTPGYWAWGDDGYYWVPGTWVLPPEPGLLWTPGYWGWSGGVYLWHGGYWGPHVGFYGGVNYGFGYGGVGFMGGYWHGGSFYYNRSVANLGGVHITNVYNRTVINNVNASRVSFNGGAGGLHARPTAHELSAQHDHHFDATSMQRDHQHVAAVNRDLRASVNHGRPPVAASARAGEFSGRGVVGARGSGPHGGAAHDVAHNGGPIGAHGGPQGQGGPGAHGGPAPHENHAAASPRPGGDRPGSPAMSHNDAHPVGGARLGGPAMSHNDAHPVGGDRPGGPAMVHNDAHPVGGARPGGGFGGGSPAPAAPRVGGGAAPPRMNVGSPGGGRPGGAMPGGRPGGGMGAMGGGRPGGGMGGGHPGGGGGGGHPQSRAGGGGERPPGHR